jgi:cob(I)alamin adenosyltransferase
MSIYTRTGDTGTTALFGGKRVLKCEELVDVYGSIDELNSWIGYIVSQIEVVDVRIFLQAVQSDLFSIGSVLAGWNGSLASLNNRIDQMEARIDIMEKELPPLTNFILPGGSSLGAFIHVVRGVCRKVERQTVALAQKQTVDPMIIKYVNRLSDLFFMLARFINKNANVEEVVWSGISRNLKK